MSACMLCGSPFPGKEARAAREWRWFTGCLDRTVHFCPTCRNAEQIPYLFARSREPRLPGQPRINVDLAIALWGAPVRKYRPPEPEVEIIDPGERERAIQYASLFVWQPGEERGEYRRTSFAATCADDMGA
jgi:hypothetical protein